MCGPSGLALLPRLRLWQELRPSDSLQALLPLHPTRTLPASCICGLQREARALETRQPDSGCDLSSNSSGGQYLCPGLSGPWKSGHLNCIVREALTLQSLPRTGPIYCAASHQLRPLVQLVQQCRLWKPLLAGPYLLDPPPPPASSSQQCSYANQDRV